MISGNNPSARPKVHFNQLIVLETTTVVFENLDISGKISVASHTKIIFKNCNIHNLDHNKCTVEIFGKSCGLFENCSLDNGSIICRVIIDGSSFACFSKCTVNYSVGEGILVMDLSVVKALNCKFSQCKNLTVDVDEKARHFYKIAHFKICPKNLFVMWTIPKLKFENVSLIPAMVEKYIYSNSVNFKLLNVIFKTFMVVLVYNLPFI